MERRYTVYSLVTEKDRVHGWQDTLSLGKLSPFAPRNLDKLRNGDKFPEIEEADRKYIVTNADDSELKGLDTWKVIRP